MIGMCRSLMNMGVSTAWITSLCGEGGFGLHLGLWAPVWLPSWVEISHSNWPQVPGFFCSEPNTLMNSQSVYRVFRYAWCCFSLPLDMYLARNWLLLTHCRMLHCPIQLLPMSSFRGKQMLLWTWCYSNWAKTTTDQTVPRQQQSMLTDHWIQPNWLTWQVISQCHCTNILPYGSWIFSRRRPFRARRWSLPHKKLLDKIHEGHQGITKCRESKAVPLVAWPLQGLWGTNLVLSAAKLRSKENRLWFYHHCPSCLAHGWYLLLSVNWDRTIE